MMAKQLTVLIILLLGKASLFAQTSVTIEVRINHLIPTNGAFIFFPLSNDTINISSRSSFTLDISIKENRLFYCVCNDKKSRFYNLNDQPILNNYLDFTIENKSYYDSIYKIRSCPLCHRSENAVPFVYGKPGKQAIEAAERGEIKLAGCVLSHTSPEYYCKYDKLEF
jgi:hypothetical protein